MTFPSGVLWALVSATLLTQACGGLSAAEESHVEADSTEIDRLIDEFDRRRLLSGTVFVRFKDGSTYARGIQMADDELRLPNETQTPILIASVSKSYTAAAILRLEEMGRLSVDDPVSKFFPEYPERNLKGSDGRPATLHHLLNHTSGIVEAYEDPRIDSKLYKQSITIQEIIDVIKNRPLKRRPGTRFEYSNTGYILLGEVVRRVSGQSFGDFAAAQLFRPLGLQRTFVGYPPNGTPRVAAPYERVGNRRVNYLTRHGIRETHITDIFTDGNLVATAQEVALWAYGVGQGKLLSPASLAKAFRDYGADYGYGWTVRSGSAGKHISHNGGWVGYVSYVEHAIDTGVTMAYLLNQVIPEREETRFRERLRSLVFSSR